MSGVIGIWLVFAGVITMIDFASSVDGWQIAVELWIGSMVVITLLLVGCYLITGGK